MSETIEQSTALAIIPAASLPTLIAADKQDIFGKLRAELSGFKADPTTDAGMKKIASVGYKVSVAKQDFIRLADSLKANHQTVIKLINDEIKIVTENMDTLRDQIKAPLIEHKAREDRRKAAHEAALAEIVAWGTIPPDWTAEQIAGRIDEMQDSPLVDREWQEWETKARDAYRAAMALVRAAHVAAVQREDDARELAQLREETATREREATAQRHRDQVKAAAEQAAAEATRRAQEDADRKAKEAAEAAQREREAAERQLQAQAAALAEAERRHAQAELQREAERVRGHGLAMEVIQGIVSDACSPYNTSATIRGISNIMDGMKEMTREWQEFSDQAASVISAGRARIASRLAEVEAQEEAEREKRATDLENERLAKVAAAQRQADEAAAEATRKEKARAAEAMAEEQRQTAIREADTAHKAKFNNEAALAFHAAGFTTGQSKTIVTLIARGGAPHIRMEY